MVVVKHVNSIFGSLHPTRLSTLKLVYIMYYVILLAEPVPELPRSGRPVHLLVHSEPGQSVRTDQELSTVAAVVPTVATVVAAVAAVESTVAAVVSTVAMVGIADTVNASQDAEEEEEYVSPENHSCYGILDDITTHRRGWNLLVIIIFKLLFLNLLKDIPAYENPYCLQRTIPKNM